MAELEERRSMLARIEDLEKHRRATDEKLNVGVTTMKELSETQKAIQAHQASSDHNVNVTSAAVEDLKILFKELTEDIGSLKKQLVDFLEALSVITALGKVFKWFRKSLIWLSGLVGAMYVLINHSKDVWKWLTNS